MEVWGQPGNLASHCLKIQNVDIHFPSNLQPYKRPILWSELGKRRINSVSERPRAFSPTLPFFPSLSRTPQQYCSASLGIRMVLMHAQSYGRLRGLHAPTSNSPSPYKTRKQRHKRLIAPKVIKSESESWPFSPTAHLFQLRLANPPCT